jgi:threonine dehydrogenase-like Zn-dependent dehydrogenase
VKVIAYDGQGVLVPQSRAVPRPPGPGEVLVRPTLVGLCFSEKHTLLRPTPNWSAGLVWGHEFGGRVEQAGAGVAGLSPGDRVAVNPLFRCGDCAMCRAGFIQRCECGACLGVSRWDGALAELVVVRDYMCFPISDRVSDLGAASVEALACGTRVARESAMRPGSDVVFLGADDYNLAALQWARIGGARTRIMADPSVLRLQAAAKVGATQTIDASEQDPAAAIRDLLPRGADVVFVALEDYVPAAADYLRIATEITRVKGQIVIGRIYSPDAWARIDVNTLWHREIQVAHFGAHFSEEPERGGRANGDFQTTIGALETGILQPELYEPEIADFWALETTRQVDELYEAIPAGAVKVLCRVGGSPASDEGADHGA